MASAHRLGQDHGVGHHQHADVIQSVTEKGFLVGDAAFLAYIDAIPEPASVVLLGTGAMLLVRRNRRQAK